MSERGFAELGGSPNSESSKNPAAGVEFDGTGYRVFCDCGYLGDRLGDRFPTDEITAHFEQQHPEAWEQAKAREPNIGRERTHGD